jgi:hypothetical protein
MDASPNAPKIWDGALASGITHPTFQGFGVIKSIVCTP